MAFSDDLSALVVHDALCVGIWSGEPSPEALARGWAAVRARAEHLGRPVAMLAVVPSGAPIPALADAPAIGRAVASVAPSLIAVCIVVEGHGPWVERALDVLSLLDAARIAFRPDSLPRKYVTSVGEGAAWIAAALRRSGESGPSREEILDAVALGFAHAGP